jgi:hypothetical protein
MATKDEAQLLAALAAEDDAFDALRDRAARMVGSMMNQAERILEVGTPSDKAQFTKTVLPAILKSLQDKKEGDDLAELRQAQADFMQEVREALLRPVERPDDVVPGLPTDGEPPSPDDVPAPRRTTRPRKADAATGKVAPRGKARNSKAPR